MSFENALELIQKANEKLLLEIYILNNLGLLSERLNDYENGISYYEKALELYSTEDFNKKEDKVKTLNGLGRVYQIKKEYSKSQEYYHEVLKLFENENPEIECALVQNNLGYLFEITGDLDKAIYHYNESLKIKESLLPYNDRSIRVTLKNLIVIYKKAGKDLTESEPLLERMKLIEESFDKEEFDSFQIKGI